MPGAPRPSTIRSLSDRIEIWVRGRLWLQVVIALIAGVLVGTLLGPDVKWVKPELADDVGRWLALPERSFLA